VLCIGVETGHSLGGQEADFVEATETTATTPPTYSTQAVTFNAPGVPTAVVKPGKSYDALTSFTRTAPRSILDMRAAA
jgi:hypothetical protein